MGVGEIVGFLGPNGAGKTTTMKILTGFISATEGSFRVAGFDGFQDSLEVRRRIGYLPENAPLYPDMGIVEYLHFVCDIRRIPRSLRRQRIDKMVSVCGLTPMIRKNIGELSKGYKRGVGLAQALIHEPPVLILDEPTSGLDPNQIVEIRKLIKELGRERTIILSTHNLPEVQMTCSRIIIIANGAKVADGTAEELEVAGRQSHRFLLTLGMGEGFTAASAVDSLNSVSGVQSVQALSEDAVAATLAVDCDGDAEGGELIFSHAIANQWRVRELKRDIMDLEKVFHQLTQY